MLENGFRPGCMSGQWSLVTTRYEQGVSGLGWASADWFGDEGYVDDHFKVGSFLSIEVRHFLMKSFLANLILFQNLFWYIFLNIRQRQQLWWRIRHTCRGAPLRARVRFSLRAFFL